MNINQVLIKSGYSCNRFSPNWFFSSAIFRRNFILLITMCCCFFFSMCLRPPLDVDFKPFLLLIKHPPPTRWWGKDPDLTSAVVCWAQPSVNWRSLPARWFLYSLCFFERSISNKIWKIRKVLRFELLVFRFPWNHTLKVIFFMTVHMTAVSYL